MPAVVLRDERDFVGVGADQPRRRLPRLGDLRAPTRARPCRLRRATCSSHRAIAA